MGVRLAVVIVLAASLAVAGAVALASRTPATLRRAELDPAANDPSLGARFSATQVARGAAYSRPAYLGFLLGTALEIVLLVVLARGPWRSLVERVEALPGGWIAQALLVGAAAALLSWLVSLPLAYVRGYVVEHAWGLSTQSTAEWLTDRLRSLLVATAIGAVSALAFFAVVRWQPRTWWLW